ncbi:hypothetical protein DPMN_110663 [Dreissena polymorpha]|uniref:Uncharacterized protein n=1 Tax=Dreissena polymorpha TaxID=45954 RepID=A0A9D4KCH0_DREPO|nr:hypothetical protein DPMN_110663 [Dreissena polymorpha]
MEANPDKFQAISLGKDHKIRHQLFPLQRGQALGFSTAKLQRPIDLQLLPKSGQRMEWRELRLFLLFRSFIALFIY